LEFHPESAGIHRNFHGISLDSQWNSNIPWDSSGIHRNPWRRVKYCNQRTVAEDAADHLRDWAGDCGIAPDYIAFYHSKVGQKRKRELEEKL
jgi:hypothetical protein